MASSLSPKELASKAEEINQVLSEAEIDLWKLRELALSDGGLVDGTLLVAKNTCKNMAIDSPPICSDP